MLSLPYVSSYPDLFSNVSNLPVARPLLMSTFFGLVNEVDSQNKSRQSDFCTGQVLGDAMWLGAVVYYCCYGDDNY